MENMCLNTLDFISFFSECHRLRAAVQVRMWCKLFSMNARRWANSSFLPVLTGAVSPGLRCWNADIGFWEIKQVCTTPPHHAGGSHFCEGKAEKFQEPGQHHLLKQRCETSVNFPHIAYPTKALQEGYANPSPLKCSVLLPQRASSPSPHREASLRAKWQSRAAGVRFRLPWGQKLPSHRCSAAATKG